MGHGTTKSYCADVSKFIMWPKALLESKDYLVMAGAAVAVYFAYDALGQSDPIVGLIGAYAAGGAVTIIGMPYENKPSNGLPDQGLYY